MKTDDVLFESQSRIVLVLEQIVQAQTKTKNMQIIILKIVLCTVEFVGTIYTFLEGLEDTLIKGTFPPGLQTCAQEPALMLSHRPEGEKIEHGLHCYSFDVRVDSLQRKVCER